MRLSRMLGIGLLACGVALIPSRDALHAESWCAVPLVVHEWGVQVFAAAGASRHGVQASMLPTYFHNRPSSTRAAVGVPVRTLPADSGNRELPVLYFYGEGGMGGRNIPVGVEVGFARGQSSVWYPQVDSRESTGNTRLSWDSLLLTTAPQHTRAATNSAWVNRARDTGDALWVNSLTESERFVFYEGRTRETPAISFERGDTYGNGRHHYVMRNTSTNPVFDVFVINRTGTQTSLFYVPSVPAGRSAGFLLEEHVLSEAQFAQASRADFRAHLQSSRAAERSAPMGSDCPMMRNPAVPASAATDYHLYAAEIDTLLDVWGPRFFDAQGTTVIYREDIQYVDAMMPIAIYTDMYHDVRLSRASFALMEAVRLP